MHSTTQEVTQMNARSPRIARLAGAAVIAALVAVTAASLASASRPLTPAPVSHVTPRGVLLPGTTFSSLAQAVAAGKVDAGLVSRLRTNGSIDAMVTFDSTAILRHAERSTGRGRSRASRLLALVRPELHAEKTNALSGIRRLEVLQPLENLPLSHVRFD